MLCLIFCKKLSSAVVRDPTHEGQQEGDEAHLSSMGQIALALYTIFRPTFLCPLSVYRFQIPVCDRVYTEGSIVESVQGL